MKIFLAILIFLYTLPSQAQNRITDNNTIGWLSTTITPKINNKFSGHIEYIWRRNDIITHWQQSLLRLGINYKINEKLTVHAGYGWIETYPYGEPTIAAIPKTFTEHRLYQQVLITDKIGKAALSHRFRLEERWVGRYANINDEKEKEFIYTTRVRYMPKLQIPLTKKLFLAAADEVFIGFGKSVGENIFDQNRLQLLVGYIANKYFKIEAGFINQVVQLGREVDNKNVFQHNNGIIINTYVNF